MIIIPQYNIKLIQEWEELTEQRNWAARRLLIPDMEKGVKEFLAYSDVDYDQQTAIWDNPPEGQYVTPWGTRYWLAYGFVFEKIVKDALESFGIKCNFSNGSKKNTIGNDSKKMKRFDITFQSLGLSGGADVKSCTLWRTPPYPGTWVVNGGLDLRKLAEINEWRKKNKKRGLLILCVPGLEGEDILDKIFVIDVGKLFDKEGWPILDDKRLTMNPQRNHPKKYYEPDSVLVNIDPDGEVVVSFKDFLNQYENKLEKII